MEDSLKLENQFCFSVYALSREIIKIYRPILQVLGLTYTQYLVMIVLWEKDGVTLKDLGRSLNLDSGTLTPLLKKLESEGFIDRKRDIKDERNLLIFLTQQGHSLAEQAGKVPQAVRCRIPLEEREMVEMRSKLQDVLAAMVETRNRREDAPKEKGAQSVADRHN